MRTSKLESVSQKLKYRNHQKLFAAVTCLQSLVHNRSFDQFRS